MSNQRASSSHHTEFTQVAREGLRVLLEGPAIETGASPKEVIWSKNKARLYRYVSPTGARFPTPLLLVYALINRPYILDLLPGNSFVEYLTRQGFAVYLLDWGTPGEEDRSLTFDDYILDYLATAVHKVLRAAHAERLSLFGYCMGGTMAAIYAALHPAPQLRNLILLSAPIDFAPEHSGMLGVWLRDPHLDVEHLAAAFGNIPAELIDLGTKMLKPVNNYVGSTVTLWERLATRTPVQTWLAMHKWINDGVPFAGAAFRQWVQCFYQRNELVAAELRLRGRQVDLAAVTCPVLAIAGRRDHICLPAQVEAITRAVASADKELLTLDAGHVGLLTGADARTRLWPAVRGWLAARSTE
jgi:polyhydroxyalkanoate synthase